MSEDPATRDPTIDDLMAFVGKFADAYSLDREKIAKDLAGPSELATLIRAMVGVERPSKRSGRPPNPSRKWRIARAVQVSRVVSGLTEDAAIAEVVEHWQAREGEALKFETAKRYYAEARALWPEIRERKVSLADMFYVRQPLMFD